MDSNVQGINESIYINCDWEQCGGAPTKCQNLENIFMRLQEYGTGVSDSHVYSDWSEWPITYASWTLTTDEKNYPQIEKEALSLMYRIWKFHQYLYGHKFVLVTDHKQLTTLLHGTQEEHSTFSSCTTAKLCTSTIGILLWDQVENHKLKEHVNADGFLGCHYKVEKQNLSLPQPMLLSLLDKCKPSQLQPSDSKQWHNKTPSWVRWP